MADRLPPRRLRSPDNDIRLPRILRLCTRSFMEIAIACRRRRLSWVGRWRASQAQPIGTQRRVLAPVPFAVPAPRPDQSGLEQPSLPSHSLPRCWAFAGRLCVLMSRASHRPVDLLNLTTAMHDMARHGILPRPFRTNKTRPHPGLSDLLHVSALQRGESASSPQEHVTTDPSLSPLSPRRTPPERVMPSISCTEESRWPSPCGP
jgi:hypothetical protein